MTTLRPFNIIIPRIDRTGPCNVAIDVGHAAIAAGYQVSLFSLSAGVGRDDLQGFASVRRLRLSDLWLLKGIVHTHCLRPDLIGGVIALLGGRTVMTTVHNYFLTDIGFNYARWKTRLAWWMWRFVVGRANYRVCISNAMRNYYTRLLPQHSFDVAYNFRSPPPEDNTPLPDSTRAWLAAQRSSGRAVMTYIGMLSPRKNVVGLVKAVANHPELSLVLCGDGPMRDEIDGLIRDSGLEERVLRAGHVARPDRVLTQTDMLVLPSFAEGLALVIIEAIRIGKPCLLSNIAVHRELVRKGVGVVFDRHCFADFAQQATRLVREATPESAEALRSIWKEQFSPDVGFLRYQQLIEGDA